MIRRVAAVVGERIAAFELGIVCQVFGLDRRDDGLPYYDFVVCGTTPGAVPTTSGFSIDVTGGLDRAADADLIVVPAWPDWDEPVPAPLVAALRSAADRGARLLSVCTGTFALAAAGLLDGRRATTHWQFTARLAERYPLLDVVDDVLYLTDGPVTTSAGASAGIDACLHIVRGEHGAAVANALARRMVIPAHRSGEQHQYVDLPVPAGSADYRIPRLIDWMQAHLDVHLSVADMAARVLMSPRTFARRFAAVTGTTPHRWLLDQRLRHAENLLQTTDLTMEAIASRTGFGSADILRHHFSVRHGVSPTTHRDLFRAARDDAVR